MRILSQSQKGETMKTFRPMLFLALVLLIVGLACSAVSSGTDTPAQPEVTEAPVQVVPPTAVPVVTEAPTEVVTEAPTQAAVEAQDYFTEEFDTNDNWSYFVIDGGNSEIMEDDDPDVSIQTEDSKLKFDIGSENRWAYVTYDPYEYENVRVDARVINRGVNNNNVSLICRYSEDSSGNKYWYEFNIANNGLYWIYAAQANAVDEVGYGLIYNGGSNDIKAGKETNEYTIICRDRKLSLYINGKEARTVEDKQYSYTSGQVGVSASSFDTLPVAVDFDWVQISEP
jgi:hypothetical protein